MSTDREWDEYMVVQRKEIWDALIADGIVDVHCPTCGELLVVTADFYADDEQPIPCILPRHYDAQLAFMREQHVCPVHGCMTEAEHIELESAMEDDCPF